MEALFPSIVIGIAAGSLARLYLLRVDYRQYPSYPQAYVTHLFLGIIAAALGAVAIPAILEKNYQAVTFLALAAQQFREIRNMERQSLAELEGQELVERGSSYIEGIAKIFEARNYLAMVAAVVASGLALAVGSLKASPWLPWLAGAAGGILTVAFLEKIMAGEKVGAYAEVIPGKVRFEGASLFVEEVFIMNVGLPKSRETILEHGLGAVLQPIDANARATLVTPGQRQAIVHDLSSVLGIRRDLDEPEFTPLARFNHDTGRIAVVFLPMAHDQQAMLEAIRRIPIVESSKRRPLAARSGRLANTKGE